jgi:hypothetical protein
MELRVSVPKRATILILDPMGLATHSMINIALCGCCGCQMDR